MSTTTDASGGPTGRDPSGERRPDTDRPPILVQRPLRPAAGGSGTVYAAAAQGPGDTDRLALSNMERAEVLAGVGQVDQAVAAMEEAFRLSPTVAADGYARMLVRRGRDKQARGDSTAARSDFVAASMVARTAALRNEINTYIAQAGPEPAGSDDATMIGRAPAAYPAGSDATMIADPGAGGAGWAPDADRTMLMPGSGAAAAYPAPEPPSGRRAPNTALLVGGGIVLCLVLTALAAGVGGYFYFAQPQATGTPTLTATLPATDTPQPTRTPRPTVTPIPSATPTPTDTPVPTATPATGATVNSAQDGMTLIYIGGGQFTRGSATSDNRAEADERPQQTVTLSSFWIDQTEVTNAMYQKCVADGKCKQPVDVNSATHTGYFTDPLFGNYPAINTSWHDANAYCTWAGRRLPTEAEWEAAARGTDGRLYPWGNEAPDTTRANFARAARDTTQVGIYPSGMSPYGLLDMAGNVWEWTADWYDANYYAAAPDHNPTGPSSAGPEAYRSVRGGSWLNTKAADLRAAHRLAVSQSVVHQDIGFRCAQTP